MSAPSSAIESVLVENRVFLPSEATQKAARVAGMAAYEALCAEAEKDYQGYWARLARENVVWSKPFTQVLDESNPRFTAGLPMANSTPVPTAWTSTWGRRLSTKLRLFLKPMTAK